MRTSAATRLIVVLVLGATTLTACSGPTSRQFSMEMSTSDGSYRLPVVLNDETGLITRIESTPAEMQGNDYMAPAVRVDPGDPNSFILSWLGGACDNHASLTLKRFENGYELRLAVDTAFGGCIALGVFRDVRIVTSSPISVDSIVVGGTG